VNESGKLPLPGHKAHHCLALTLHYAQNKDAADTYKPSKSQTHTTLSIERNPFSAQNQTLKSYRVYISPTK